MILETGGNNLENRMEEGTFAPWINSRTGSPNINIEQYVAISNTGDENLEE